MAGGHVEGMCMATGVCMGGVHVGGHVCMVGGGDMHGRGAYKVGACMTCIPPGRYYSYTIWSMSGRYASYWNAFLLCAKIIFEFLPNVFTHLIESSYKIIVKNYLNLQHFV